MSPEPGARLFGTDGIRGPFGEYPLVRPTVTALGLVLARRLHRSSPRPLVVLGGDTRASTSTICRWLSNGLRAGGAEVRFAGVVPTPAIAALTRELGADCGIAVSASHNPLPDNGIKLIDRNGFKWPIEDESELERELAETASETEIPSAELVADPALVDRYVEFLRSRLPGEGALDGLEVVVDAAHGAASGLGALLFEGLGARVTALCDSPDGHNINRGCGSTHPEKMAAAVRDTGSAIGFAFDGDADRAIFADERGTVRDGDAILYLWARSLLARGRLDPAAIVATTMSNLGLETALARDGIEIVRCPVGDRSVVNSLLDRGIALGGEQSGHIVHLESSTTGDGIFTAVQVAAVVAAAQRPVSELLAGFQRFPQILKNVRVRAKPDLLTIPDVGRVVADVEDRLGTKGRLVLRYSGTEPLARVMIEGPELAEIDSLANRIIESIQREIGQDV